jgi:hypothetical protein
MATYHRPNPVSVITLFRNSFAYLPEAKTVGGHVIKCRLLLLLYRFLEGTDGFLSVDLDRKHVSRIVGKYPAIQRDNGWRSRCLGCSDVD